VECRRNFVRAVSVLLSRPCCVCVWVRSSVGWVCSLCGVTPFSTAKSAVPLHRQICYALRPDFRLLFPDHVSLSARDLVCKLITPAQHRLTAEQALAHPWLKEDKSRPSEVHRWHLQRLATFAPSEGLGFSCKGVVSRGRTVVDVPMGAEEGTSPPLSDLGSPPPVGTGKKHRPAEGLKSPEDVRKRARQ
jgi:hypothetical protein